MATPENLSYTESHEWCLLEGDKATIGLTDYAQEQLGDIVFVNLPEVGDTVTAGESFADVESVKAVSEVICPVSGTVCEVNEALLDDPSLVNQAAYDTWFIRVEGAEVGVEILDAAAYEAICD